MTDVEGKLILADLPLILDRPFRLWSFGEDLGLMLLRNLGDYPRYDNDEDEDDSFVPQVTEVMFTRVLALAARRYHASLTVRAGTAAERESLTSWIVPESWRESRLYVLGDELDAGWVIAQHVYWAEYTMLWDAPSPLVSQLPWGTVPGEVHRDR